VAELTFVVSEQDTAVALGSGDVEVLATPRLLAWLEAATVAAAADIVRPAETTVGTRVEMEHLAATAVGIRVTVTSDLAHRDGRLLRFAVGAHDGDDRLLASGTVTRVVVDRERFLSRLPG
jgi:fluoroacetyl-CoA thioesterase